MAQVDRLASVVMFVQQLDRSVSFYREVLGLEVADSSPTAALLTGHDESNLILRSMGSQAVHALGSVGVQYVTWIADSKHDLEQCEQALRKLSAHRETRTMGDAVAVEGRDPDDIVVMVVYPGPDRAPLRELPVRIYGW